MSDDDKESQENLARMIADTERDRQLEKQDELVIPYRLLATYIIIRNIPHGCWIMIGDQCEWQGLNWSMLYDLIDRQQITNYYPLRSKRRKKEVYDHLMFFEVEMCRIQNERITKRLKQIMNKHKR